MRKISKDAAKAFLEERKFKRGNTEVEITKEAAYLLLHKNVIAYKMLQTPDICVRDAGWQTVTTKERINTLLELAGIQEYIFQKDFEWYLKNRVTGKVEEWTSKVEEWMPRKIYKIEQQPEEKTELQKQIELLLEEKLNHEINN